MAAYVAFLRGMNLGKRRITNEELCRHFEAMGFAQVSAFLASGNVLFETSTDIDLENRIAAGLLVALDYEVPTFVRSAAELREIIDDTPLSVEARRVEGKVQVALLQTPPGKADTQAVAALSTPRDSLVLRGRELYWLPDRGISNSELKFSEIEKQVGQTTVRTLRTFQRLAAKLAS